MKKTAIRFIRKTSHISNRALRKAERFTSKVENKTNRIIGGSDYTVRLTDSTPLEKLYFADQKWITPLNPALPSIGQKKSVSLLIPTIDDKSFYGGTATALIVAGRMAQLSSRPLKIIQTLKTGKSSGLSTFLKNNGVEIDNDSISITSVAERSYNVYGYLPMHPDDYFIASAWWDAYLLQQLPLENKFVYLIQDFEPIFYNNSDSYILAESTYNNDGFIPLCNTKLMFDFMKNRKYNCFDSDNNSFWFEPAVSRIESGRAIKKKQGEKLRLFVYGRPNVHRNLFFSALNAIDYSLKAGYLNKDNWEFYMAGQSDIPDVMLSNGVKIKNLGKMNLADYIKFSKTIDLAVSPMMAPHPNYPTLEFASIGSSVVTTKYSNKIDLSNYSSNIVMSDTSVESLAGAIKEASLKTYDERIKNLKSTKINKSWSKSIDTQLKTILKELS